MKNRIIILLVAFIGFSVNEINAQCAAGAAAAPVPLTCTGAGACDGGTSTVTVPAGTQICLTVTDAGSYTFATCGNTTDDTMITVFDGGGVVLGNNDDFCGVQSSTIIAAAAGDVLCVQAESFLCDGTGSDSPTYDVTVSCPMPPAVGLGCAVADFDETQTIDDNTIATNGNTFSFNTGTGPFTSGVATLCGSGDLDGPSTGADEAWVFTSETGALCGVGNTGNINDQCGANPICITIDLTAADINNWASDGTITLMADDLTGDINLTGLCNAAENFITAQIQLCSNAVVPPVPVPTLGEWGIILSCLFLLSLGTIFLFVYRGKLETE